MEGDTVVPWRVMSKHIECTARMGRKKKGKGLRVFLPEEETQQENQKGKGCQKI